MDCREAAPMLSCHAIGALSIDEQALLQQHLNTPCQTCQRELDELLEAASLLAETTTPVPVPGSVKQSLLQRIQSEQHQLAENRASVELPIANPTPPSWLARLPYIAATILAVVAGAWVAKARLQSDGHDGSPILAVNQSEIDAWKQRIENSQQQLGPPLLQLASLESGATNAGLRVVFFCDNLAQELHVFTWSLPAPAADRQLWLWLMGQDGDQLAQGSLSSFVPGQAAGVLSFSVNPNTLKGRAAQVLITAEASDQPQEPSADVVGRAKLKRPPNG